MAVEQRIVVYSTPVGLHAYSTAYDSDQAADAITDIVERYGAGTSPRAVLASTLRPEDTTARLGGGDGEVHRTPALRASALRTARLAVRLARLRLVLLATTVPTIVHPRRTVAPLSQQNR